MKLEKKVACGAHFIINQIGFDSRKQDELRQYMDRHAMPHVPLIGNVYVLSPRVAQVFHGRKIPGVVVTPALLELCRRHGQSPDGGRAFFQEFAAKQMAIYRGLGYRGAYLGGVHGFDATRKIIELERTFAPGDWKQFVREMKFSTPGEFYYYAENPATGLADASRREATAPARSRHVAPVYRLSKWTHDVMFNPSQALAKWGARACRNSTDPEQGPKPMRALEHLSKAVLFQCKDCGDCSLPDIAFLCPESQCAKNQRNGPCGGTQRGTLRSGRLRRLHLAARLRTPQARRPGTGTSEHAPVVQNQGLRGTSAWANFWLGPRSCREARRGTGRGRGQPGARQVEGAWRKRPQPTGPRPGGGSQRLKNHS